MANHRNIQTLTTEMYKVKNGLAPEIVSNFFVYKSNVSMTDSTILSGLNLCTILVIVFRIWDLNQSETGYHKNALAGFLKLS